MNIFESHAPFVDEFSRRFLAIAAGCCIVFALPGCEESTGLTEVSGVVTYQGKPLTDGSLTFVPAGDQGRGASGKIGSDGYYELFTSKSLKGISPGDYTVRIESWETLPGMAGGGPAKMAVPEKYYLANTSPLRATVEDVPSQTIDITIED